MIWTLIYVFIGAAQEVVLGSALQSLDPIGSLFVSFGFAALYFTFVKIWKSKRSLPAAGVESGSAFRDQALGLKVLINLATLAAWGGFFLSLKYVEPAIVSMVCFSIGPLMTTVYKIFRGQRSNALVWCGALLIVGLLWFGYVVHSDRSGLIVTSIVTSKGLSGYLWAIVSGFGIVGNTLLTKRLMNRGFTSNQVLANRFTLLILVSGIAILSGFSKLPNLNESLALIVFSVLTIIIPVVILNRGIQQISSHIVSLILATMPIVTFVMQLMDSRLVPSLPTLVGIGMMTVAVMLGLKAEIPQARSQSV